MPAPHFLLPLVRRSDSAPALCLYASNREEPLARHLETAFDSVSRRRGLLGRSHLPIDHALVIAPCNLIHTFRMAFAIDVVFAARDGRIVKLRHDMRAGRVSGALGGFAAIEVAAGTIARTQLSVGQYLEVRVWQVPC